MGLRLRDLGWSLTWHDLGVIVSHLPRSSALVREVLGKDYEWDLANHLRAAEVDALRIANWQRTEDGTKNRNEPTPIPRPGVEQEKKYGREPVSMEEGAERLARRRHLAAGDHN